MISPNNTIIITSILLITSFSFLAYIFIGYPAIIFGLSKLFGKSVKKNIFFPNVTIIIPAFNEEGVIKEKIKNTLSPVSYTHLALNGDGSNSR